MAMIDLKRSKTSDDDDDGPKEMAEPVYPWGLSMYLHDETLDKLGVAVEDFGIGDEFEMKVRVRVTSISQREHEDGEKMDSVDLQVTGIDRPGGDDNAKRAERIFGSSE